ncbi:MAG TPA: PP2C family protein-serine/threonine phosphatase [Kofleriaceae bacterium]|jgi:serine phosphatase RsbU (regulator of sigma subunit)|nr:PP2C family protein-serine/threonine phosphatase [Kofleriaceae bacterium]
MHALWSSTSYEPRLLSLVFALAPAALLIVIAYAAVMRGAPVLRGFLLAHCASLLPYATAMMLSPSITSPAVAEQLFRVAGAFVPMAGAAGTGFQIALIGKFRPYRWLVWLLVASAAIWVYAGSTGSAEVNGVRWLSGFWYANAGPWAWLALAHTLAMTIPGFIALGHAVLTTGPSVERRQLRAALLANLVTYAGLIDVGLAYGIGSVPLGWLLSGIGCLLVVRALIVEDLLRVRAVDTTAPLLVVYFAAGALLAWAALAALAAPIPWPLTTLALVVCFAAVRISVATVSLVNHGGRSEGPLDRLLTQLAGRARTLTAPGAIAQLAIDIIELGLGVRPHVLIASQDDWGWTTETGERLDDARAPDPLLAGWLAEQRDAVFGDDLEPVPADLRALVAGLFAGHRARALIAIGNADELLGLIVIPAVGRRLGVPALGFLLRAAERLAEALLHARLALRAAERAALAREVELAATVQAALLPGVGPHVHGDVTVVGSWRPATRCAGDFWTALPLGDAAAAARPLLIVIGDVTGHGVASAMVTAAAIGACEVCVRRAGAGLELPALVAALDAAVRRVGGGSLAMTCAAAIIDPTGPGGPAGPDGGPGGPGGPGGEIRFVSCGHPASYLCRPTDKAVELHALVGRGNPLGIGTPAAPRVHRRPLQAGDLVVWYTDGVVEAQDPAGAAFGDRRLQHLLKKLDRPRLAPLVVHDLVNRGVAAHRAGRPLADDETLVVAQLAAVPAAALAPAAPAPAAPATGEAAP